MSTNDALLTLCYELEKSGITPTVAMVRNKAPKRVPLQAAIDAVQRFQKGVVPSNQELALPEQESAVRRSLEERITDMECQIEWLTDRLNRLEKIRD